MRKTLSRILLESIYHDHFVESQANYFRKQVKARGGKTVVDVGGRCGFFDGSLYRRTSWPLRVLDTD